MGTKGRSVASAAVTMVTSEQLSLVSFYREGSTRLAFPEAHSARPSRKHYPKDPEDPRDSGIWQPVSASGATCFSHGLGSTPNCHGASTALSPWDLLSPNNPHRPCLSATSGWRQQPGVGWGGVEDGPVQFPPTCDLCPLAAPKGSSLWEDDKYLLFKCNPCQNQS